MGTWWCKQKTRQNLKANFCPVSGFASSRFPIPDVEVPIFEVSDVKIIVVEALEDAVFDEDR